MLKIFGNKEAKNNGAQHRADEDESIRLDEQTAQRLHDDLEAISLKLSRSKAEAARCLASPGGVSAQELQNALVAEREDAAAQLAAVRAHEEAAARLDERRAEITKRRADEDRAERRRAYDEARAAYWAQCEALIKPAFEVRRLAAAADVWMPNWEPGDLLFADDSDISVAGQPLSIWKSA